MNYFNPYPLLVDDTLATARKSQIADAAKTPLAELLDRRAGELLPRFIHTYTELRALPRGARRALQRQLAHSRELSASLQEWLQQTSGRELQQKLACTLAGAALLLALSQGIAQANTITVGAKVPPGILADGKCSLIEAILNANDTSTGQPFPDCVAGDPIGEDHIILPAKGSFALTGTYGYYYYGNIGLPLITSKITIEGNGAKITRSKKAPTFRLMAVGIGGELELQNLTLSGGNGYLGGAIFNPYDGELTITNCTITGNTAYLGGGIYNAGSLTVQNSTISKNTAKGLLNGTTYYGGLGGGIANYGYGALTVTNSTITGNTAVAGGGIGNSGNMEISGSTISKNSALYGGGIGNVGGTSPTQTIANSTISGNSANIKSVKLYGYTYFFGGFGGGIINYNGSLTITNSTISGNKATGKAVKVKYGKYTITYAYGGIGGGIYNNSGSYLTLSGGSVTSNSATFYGGGLANIYGSYSSTANITGNKAKYSPNIFSP